MRNDEALVRALSRVGSWLNESGYNFVTVTPATHARVVARDGKREASSLHDIFGWSPWFCRSLPPGQMQTLLEEAGLVEYVTGSCAAKSAFLHWAARSMCILHFQHLLPKRSSLVPTHIASRL